MNKIIQDKNIREVIEFQTQLDQTLSINYSSKLSKMKSDLITQLNDFTKYYSSIIKTIPITDSKSLRKSDTLVTKFGTLEEIRKMILQQSRDHYQLQMYIKSLKIIILDHIYCSGPWEDNNNNSGWKYWSLSEDGNIYGLRTKLIRNYQGSSYKECVVRSIYYYYYYL